MQVTIQPTTPPMGLTNNYEHIALQLYQPELVSVLCKPETQHHSVSPDRTRCLECSPPWGPKPETSVSPAGTAYSQPSCPLASPPTSLEGIETPMLATLWWRHFFFRLNRVFRPHETEMQTPPQRGLAASTGHGFGKGWKPDRIHPRKLMEQAQAPRTLLGGGGVPSPLCVLLV